MWEDIVKWWKALWVDHKPVATAIAGFASAFLMFVIKDAIWQRRVTREQKREEFQQKRLESFYAPLYRFYREAYARFDYWRAQNPDTKIERQPFFEPTTAESFAENLFAEQAGLASQDLLGLWADFMAINDKVEKNRRRNALVEKVVKEYNVLRQELKLDYNENELNTGTFS
jgi:hypothetical protein